MCEYETLGAHIRNALGSCYNLAQLLNDYKQADEENDTEMKQLFLKLILESSTGVEHLLEISRMPEVEAINWRETELYKQYSKE